MIDLSPGSILVATREIPAYGRYDGASISKTILEGDLFVVVSNEFDIVRTKGLDGFCTVSDIQWYIQYPKHFKNI